MSDTATEPRRITGPWDEKIVQAHTVMRSVAALDSPLWHAERLSTDERQAARRNALYMPGEPATMSIGSDSYRMLVVGADRFQSGAKKGEVKAVHVVHLMHDDTVRPVIVWDFQNDPPTFTLGVETYTRREPRAPGTYCWTHAERVGRPSKFTAQEIADCFSCWERSQPRFIEKGNDYCSLVVGYAYDYRDPHF